MMPEETGNAKLNKNDIMNQLVDILYRLADYVFYVINGVGKLIREFGMPTVTVGAGVAVVVVLIRYKGGDAIFYQTVVGLALVAFGLIAQVTIYFRDNAPKVPQTDPVLAELLERLTKILGDRASPPPTDPVLAKQLEELTKIVDKVVQRG